jgi:hypothetical protein
MILDRTIENYMDIQLRIENTLEHLGRTPSGKLSASGLYKPLQWQVLKSIGVLQNEPDEYALRKFARGKEVEKWVTQFLPGLLDTQKKVTYRGCVGVVDAICGTSEWEFKGHWLMPHEIKSVANSKFKWINTRKEADPGHRLQAAFYAKALGVTHYAIDYVASDDYRVLTWIYDLSVYGDMVDEIITRFEQAILAKKIPLFVPNEKWQADIKYNDYPEWSNLNEHELMVKLEKEYPKSYEKLLKGGE